MASYSSPLKPDANAGRVALVTGAALVGGIVVAMRAAKSAELAGSSGASDEGWHGPVYCNPSDARLWLPKRSGLGWTLNFGHRSAWLVLFLLVAPAIVALIVTLAATRR